MTFMLLALLLVGPSDAQKPAHADQVNRGQDAGRAGEDPENREVSCFGVPPADQSERAVARDLMRPPNWPQSCFRPGETQQSTPGATTRH
jgi:hypothetical protein